MSACVPADIIPSTGSGTVMTACQTWRKAAIAKLTRIHPAVLLVTGTRGFATVNSHGTVLKGTARTNAWIAGMKRTLTRLKPIAGRVILMADTPNSRFSSSASCLRAHLLHELACATPVLSAVSYTWLNVEFHVALATHTAFIDTERWVCPTSPCPAVIGTHVLYRNAGHITATFNRLLWRKLETAVLAIRAGTVTIVGP